MATYTINNSDVRQSSGFTPAGTLAGGDILIIPSGWTNHLYFLDVVGANGNPIRVTNPSDAKISITDNSTSSISFARCRYIILDGSNYASETYGIYVRYGYFGLRMYEAEDIEIKYVEVSDTQVTGIKSQDGTWAASHDVENIIIHNCYIHNIATEGIYFGNSNFDPDIHASFKDCKIYSNIVEDCGWDCIQLGAADQGTNEIYGNYCKNCGTAEESGQMAGIISNYGTTGDIYKNTVINAYATGIYIHSGTKQINMYNNVIIDSKSVGIACGSSQNGNTIINNTIVNRDPNQTTYPGIRTGVGVTLGELRYNLVVGTLEAGEISSSYSIIQDNLTSYSIPDQYFKDINTDNFRLTALSPAKDYSSNAGYFPTDADGVTRPVGTNADAGAFEYVGDSPNPYTRRRGILHQKPRYNQIGGRFR